MVLANYTKWFIIIGLFLVIVFVLVFSYSSVFNQSLLDTLIINDSVLKVEQAASPISQYLGLSNRASLCSDCAMLFTFSNSQERTFVMRDMLFPLDIIFINQGKIVKIFENLPPEGHEPKVKYSSGQPADSVLEVNAGYARQHNFKIGDELKYSFKK